MTAAHCGSISALTLGLPASTAIPEQKGTLPTAMFYAKTPVSARLKQRLVHDIDGITMLAILRPENTGVEATAKLGEILVMGIRHSSTQVPVEVLEHIARLRRSGIVFVCVHDVKASDPVGTYGARSASSTPASSSPSSASSAATAVTLSQNGTELRGEISALAVRRTMPGKAGHPQQSAMLVGPWQPAAQTRLVLAGATFEELWDSLCAQAILDSSDGSNFDERLALREHIAELKAQEAKLAKDHARTKQSAQRNEIYAKLHKVRAELSRLDG